jgi:hypothetical protein
VAADLAEFARSWRATGVRYWSESSRALDQSGEVRWEDLGRASGDDVLAHVADVGLPALAVELEGKLCRSCARVEAERREHLRKLAFIGAVAASPGRDERAEEEFQLQAVAA